MAENGDFFVVDMNKQVKIYIFGSKYDSPSGRNNLEIIENSLCSDEKLHEELLADKENLEKTMI